MNRKLKLNELNRLSVDDYKKVKKNPIVVVLNNIRSLNNVGSFFRTCDAFAIEKIILTGITACPPHKEIRKTALGATDSVHWEYNENCVEVVKKHKKLGYKTFAIEQTIDSIKLNDSQHNSAPSLLIFGNEVDGVEQEVIDNCDHSIEIPQFGTKHSFNVSVSGGIILWHFINQRL